MFEMLINLFASAFKSFIKARLLAMFEAVRKKDPARHKLLLSTLYPVVDVELENITDKTATKADDELTDAIKESIEESAKAANIPLQNLDGD